MSGAQYRCGHLNELEGHKMSNRVGVSVFDGVWRG